MRIIEPPRRQGAFKSEASVERVLLKTWRVGIKKVQFAKLLQDRYGMTLSTAKRTTDSLLQGKQAILEFQSLEDAKRFQSEAVKLGVETEFVQNTEAVSSSWRLGGSICR